MSQDRADKYAGITNEERPLVGVRGEQKDLKRVVRLKYPTTPSPPSPSQLRPELGQLSWAAAC